MTSRSTTRTQFFYGNAFFGELPKRAGDVDRRLHSDWSIAGVLVVVRESIGESLGPSRPSRTVSGYKFVPSLDMMVQVS